MLSISIEYVGSTNWLGHETSETTSDLIEDPIKVLRTGIMKSSWYFSLTDTYQGPYT